jgi:hypothetical protein
MASRPQADETAELAYMESLRPAPERGFGGAEEEPDALSLIARARGQWERGEYDAYRATQRELGGMVSAMDDAQREDLSRDVRRLNQGMRDHWDDAKALGLLLPRRSE